MYVYILNYLLIINHYSYSAFFLDFYENVKAILEIEGKVLNHGNTNLAIYIRYIQ